MQEWLMPYAPTVAALGIAGGLLLAQIVVLDLAGIKARHKPGTPVEVDHGKFHFRATRAHANTNESIAGFILLALFGVMCAATPLWLNGFVWLYVFARVGHMLFYYANIQLLRSISFGLGLAALIGMFVVGLLAWV